MVHEHFPRILVGSCTKCKGALKEQIDPGEWLCLNCGLLIIEDSYLIEPDRKGPKRGGGARHNTSKEVTVVPIDNDLVDLIETTVAGVIEEVKEKKDSLVDLEELKEEEEEGDDQEWEQLITYNRGTITDQDLFRPGPLPKI